MRAENQDLPFHEVTKILGNMWSQLPSNQKQVLFGVLKLFCCTKILQSRSIGKLLVCNQGLPPFGNHKSQRLRASVPQKSTVGQARRA